jgi:hypothetical protein
MLVAKIGEVGIWTLDIHLNQAGSAIDSLYLQHFLFDKCNIHVFVGDNLPLTRLKVISDGNRPEFAIRPHPLSKVCASCTMVSARLPFYGSMGPVYYFS